MRHSDPRHFAEHSSGCAACFHNFLLCRRLHDVAQTPNTAKYRHWRCGWRTPSGDRLGCGRRKCWARTAHPVPDHLPLDATPLLGTVAQSCRRICSRRCADVAGRSRQGRNKAPDSSLQRSSGSDLTDTLGTGFAGAIYGAAAAMLGAVMIFLSWQVRRSNDKERRPARRLFVFSMLYLVLLFGVLLMNAVR